MKGGSFVTGPRLALVAAAGWLIVAGPPAWEGQRRVATLEALPPATEPVEQQLDAIHLDERRVERDRAAIRLGGGLAAALALGVAGTLIGRRR